MGSVFCHFVELAHDITQGDVIARMKIKSLLFNKRITCVPVRLTQKEF
jgi:hypothetical protein